MKKGISKLVKGSIVFALTFSLIVTISACGKKDVGNEASNNGNNESEISNEDFSTNNSSTEATIKKDNEEENSNVFDVNKEEPTEKEEWKVNFEKSLLENYQVTPSRYEDLGDGIYQVYVIIDGKEVPYVTVDSKTGDYHG